MVVISCTSGRPRRRGRGSCPARIDRAGDRNRDRSSPATATATFVPPGLLLFVRELSGCCNSGSTWIAWKMSGEATTVVEQVLVQPWQSVGRTSRSRPLASWHTGPAPRATANSPGSIARGTCSKPSVLRATTEHRICHRTVSGWPTAMSTSETSGSSIWRDRPRHGSPAVPESRRRPCGFRTEARSPTDRPGWHVRKGCHWHGHRAAPAERAGERSRTRSRRTANGSCTSPSAPGGTQDVYVLPTTGDRKPQPIVADARFRTSSRNSLPTCAGSRMPRTKTAGTRSTSRRSPRRAGDGRSPATAAVSRCGGPMARSCSSSATTGSSTRSTCRRRPDPSSSACRSFSSTCAPTSSTRGTAISPVATASVSS